MKIALCMIARNEEKIIQDAILSMTGLYDKAYVLDDGSTDDTRKAAENAGAAVVTADSPLRGFAEKRNFIARMAWSYPDFDAVVWNDCDQRLVVRGDRFEFRKQLEEQLLQWEALCIRLDHPVIPNFQATYSFAYLLGKGIEWTRPVHEALNTPVRPIDQSVAYMDCRDNRGHRSMNRKESIELDIEVMRDWLMKHPYDTHIQQKLMETIVFRNNLNKAR